MIVVKDYEREHRIAEGTDFRIVSEGEYGSVIEVLDSSGDVLAVFRSWSSVVRDGTPMVTVPTDAYDEFVAAHSRAALLGPEPGAPS